MLRSFVSLPDFVVAISLLSFLSCFTPRTRQILGMASVMFLLCWASVLPSFSSAWYYDDVLIVPTVTVVAVVEYVCLIFIHFQQVLLRIDTDSPTYVWCCGPRFKAEELKK